MSELVDLVASVCPDSPAWTLVRHLAGQALGLGPGQMLGVATVHGHADISAVLSAQLSGHAPGGPRRNDGDPSCGALHFRASRRGRASRPGSLAAVAHGNDARRRPAQEQMTSALHQWVDAGVPRWSRRRLVPARASPFWRRLWTGLPTAPERTAIITTFTKQLQQQLADDVARLDSVVPGLLEASDVVKGQSNRLSLRALTELADSTTDRRRRARPGTRNRFLARPVFRELLVFLTLRLFAATDVRAAGRHTRSTRSTCRRSFLATPGQCSPCGWSRCRRQATVNMRQTRQRRSPRTPTQSGKHLGRTGCYWPTMRCCSRIWTIWAPSGRTRC